MPEPQADPTNPTIDEVVGQLSGKLAQATVTISAQEIKIMKQSQALIAAEKLIASLERKLEKAKQ